MCSAWAAAACTAWPTGNGATRQPACAGVRARPVAPGARLRHPGAALCGDYRVVCPDVVGRGQSDWLADPMGYAIPAYVADMVTLLARLDARQVHWVGTSMGGLIGLGLAVACRTRRCAPGAQRRGAGDRVGRCSASAPTWAMPACTGRPKEAAADALWAISQGFGPHTRRAVAGAHAAAAPGRCPMAPASSRTTTRPSPLPFRLVTPELAQAGQAALWASYDRLRCPTLLIRGEQSDLLSAGHRPGHDRARPARPAGRAAWRGPRAHAGAADQVALVQGFLREP
jgi:pimeloyl-ACP methyl ester carboxylesterase